MRIQLSGVVHPIVFPPLAFSDSYNIFFSSVFTDSFNQALIHTNFVEKLTYIKSLNA